ncbi:MAG: elongation factor P [Bdellovibrionales bacterium]|nr:elongation factor P [Bdellovibrionales bacterium]
MVSTSHFKKGLKILVKGEPYTIIDFQHVKPGKGNQFTRTKLKHLVTETYIDLTIRSGEKFNVPDVSYKDMSFLYKDNNNFHFMDSISYEQMTISEKSLGSHVGFLTENMVVKVCLLNDQAVGIELPKTVRLKITDTDPGLKGNTATSATKLATLETGLVIQVPLHLNKDDIVKVNTSDSTYIERVKPDK